MPTTTPIPNLKPSPRQRLEEAVNAIRNVDEMTGAKWRSKYPSLAKVSDATDFEVAMQRELQLRIAEYMLYIALPHHLIRP